ncbi:MAG: hypothetical protein M1831_001058 [Alyxoria varia]|nr:MAG: hypothetical protein M1831_001058 [Alyxoria varia]
MISPNVQILHLEVDPETMEGQFRLLIEGSSVKYLTVDGNGIFADNCDMCFKPTLFATLPNLPEGDWNVGHVVAAEGKDSEVGQRAVFESTRRDDDLPTIRSIWHPLKVDVTDLELQRINKLASNVWKVDVNMSEDANAAKQPAIAKMANMAHEVSYYDAETAAYSWIEGSGVAPRFLGHIHEGGRCRDLLGKVHELGIKHGDINRHNFLVTPKKVWLVDWESATECDNKEELRAEMETLEDELMDESGRGGKSVVMNARDSSGVQLYKRSLTEHPYTQAGMDSSLVIKSSHPSLPSPDGLHIATLTNNHLDIRRTTTFEIVRSIDTPVSSSRFLCLRWSPAWCDLSYSTRILHATEDTVRVYDLHDTQWSATIDNGSGGMGKIANAEFGADDTEVLVFSSFGAQVTCWSLWSGRSVEIKDPKFATKGHGRSRAGRSGVFALLARPAAQDVVTLHAAGSYALMRTFTLPTVDAQGLKWSPDGRWLAVWDAPSTGYKVYIYTADGYLYRCYTGDYFDESLMGLGVKSIEWSPNGDFLAIGGYESAITLLSTRTFSPAVQLAHANTIRPSSTTIHIEEASNHNSHIRSYVQSTTPLTPNIASTSHQDNNTAPKIGTSILAFNVDGSLLASKSDAHPTTVWIWDLSALKSRAVLAQRAVVKKLQWHPTDKNLLMVQGIQGENLVYIWSAEEGPQALAMAPAVRITGKAEARWIYTAPGEKQTKVLFGDASTSVIGYPGGSDVEFAGAAKNGGDLNGDANGHAHRAEGQANPTGINTRGAVSSSETFSADEEDDSLFEILSGKKPGAGDNTYLMPNGHGSDGGISGETTDVEDVGLGDVGMGDKIDLQDTFGWKKGVALGVGH